MNSHSNSHLTTHTLKRPLLISVTVITVALTFALPLLFHLLPSSGVPLGARFLPIFYAPLLAALLFPPVVAISASLIAPFLNHALTGNPPLPMAATLSAELLVFTGVVLLMRRRWPLLPVVAPLAYLVARAVVFFALQPAAVLSGGAWGALLASLGVALPGLAVLFVLNLIVSRRTRRSA